jgi:hypothetical protein
MRLWRVKSWKRSMAHTSIQLGVPESKVPEKPPVIMLSQEHSLVDLEHASMI